MKTKDEIQCQIKDCKTLSQLGDTAIKIYEFEGAKIELLNSFKSKIDDLGYEDFSKSIYDYAMKIIDDDDELIFEDIFKFFCLYEVMLALKFMSFDGASEYQKRLSEFVSYHESKVLFDKVRVDCFPDLREI